jgi:hypothetical protein
MSVSSQTIFALLKCSLTLPFKSRKKIADAMVSESSMENGED